MLEIIILSLSWIIAIILFIIFVPKSKIRLALIGILVMQMLTWPLGMIAAEFDLIHYPIRFFPEATEVSFTFEYFVFPIVSTLFNLHYPNGSLWKGLAFTSVIVTAITIAEVILEKYTNTIVYLEWHWTWSWLSMFVILHLSYAIFRWIVKKD